MFWKVHESDPRTDDLVLGFPVRLHDNTHVKPEETHCYLIVTKALTVHAALLAWC